MDTVTSTAKHPQTVAIFLGPPGSGKGTQAGRLARELKIPHISTGNLFREHLKKETALGIQAKKYIDKGNLVPDSLVLDLLENRMAQTDCSAGFVLDGFPRTVAQAEAFDIQLQKLHILPYILNLNVSDNEVMVRLSGRLTCE